MRIFIILTTMVLAHPLSAKTLDIVSGVAHCNAVTRVCEESDALKRVWAACGLPETHDFARRVEIAQEHLLRPKGLERWQISERYADQREALMALFSQMGFLEGSHASNLHYDYGVVHGATLHRTRSRIQWLVNEYNRGVRFDAVIFLSGERKLDPQLEIPEIREQLREGEAMPETETQMVRWLWQRLDLPEGLRLLPFTLVDAKASDWRAHTGDTATEWVAGAPKAGSILAVSNQPYVSYQDMSLRNRLPSTFTLETIGEPVNGYVMNSVYLDNLARLLREVRTWQSASQAVNLAPGKKKPNRLSPKQESKH